MLTTIIIVLVVVIVLLAIFGQITWQQAVYIFGALVLAGILLRFVGAL